MDLEKVVPTGVSHRERLARILHEAGRVAVETSKVLNTPNLDGMAEQAKAAALAAARKFTEWDALPERAKDGRLLQADYLLANGFEVMELLDDYLASVPPPEPAPHLNALDTAGDGNEPALDPPPSPQEPAPAEPAPDAVENPDGV